MSALLLAALVVVTPQQRLEAALQAERQGADVAALAQLEALVVADPTWELARLEVARLRIKLGVDLDLAGWHADIARSLSPENPRAHYLFALALDELNRREAAARSLEIALALRDDYPDARFRLAGLLSALGRWSDAVIQWREYVARVPAAPGARLQLADALERSGAVKEAEHELKALLKVGPLRVPATRKLVALLERAGRRDEAARLLHTLEAPRRDLRPLRPSAR